MNITTHAADGTDVLVVDGRFDAHEVGPFRSVLDRTLQTASSVRIDLSGVRFIDSTALAELLRVRKRLEETGGRLALQPVSDPVRVILELTGLDSIFAIAPSEPVRGRG